MNQRFSVNVEASFNGLVAGDDFDAAVKGEEQYKTFEEFMQRLVSIQGGDMKLAASLGADPTQMDVYKQWAESTATYSNLCNFHVVELWSLLRDAASKDLRDVADTVQDAYQFMTNHTSIYRTRITMTIESDWYVSFQAPCQVHTDTSEGPSLDCLPRVQCSFPIRTPRSHLRTQSFPRHVSSGVKSTVMTIKGWTSGKFDLSTYRPKLTSASQVRRY